MKSSPLCACGDASSCRHVTAGEKGKPATSKPYVMAQRYVADPLLVQGRKFGIRVWVLVLGPNPLRCARACMGARRLAPATSSLASAG